MKFLGDFWGFKRVQPRKPTESIRSKGRSSESYSLSGFKKAPEAIVFRFLFYFIFFLHFYVHVNKRALWADNEVMRQIALAPSFEVGFRE